MDVTQVGGYSVEFVKTPTVSSGVAYTAGDQVGGILDLSTRADGNIVLQGACYAKDCVSTLLSLAVHDKDSQNAAYTIFFFNALPTVASSDNAALDISDAEMASKCIGTARVSAAQYDTVSASSIAAVPMPSAALAMLSKEHGGPLYAVIKTTGTPTFTSTSALTFRFLFGLDMTIE